MDSEAVFAAYHRQRNSAVVVRVVGISVALLVLAMAFAFVVVAAPARSHVVETASPPMSGGTPVATAVVLPSPTPETGPAAIEAGSGVSPPPPVEDEPWRIEIDTSGYQAELDACLWVRMDLGAVAPIVGAHRSCGGAGVLEMTTRDAVQLSGAELDGTYVVADSRDAVAGSVAATATEGLTADVILQTCYPGTDGRVRLVALLLA